jgi:hypothetical protein
VFVVRIFMISALTSRSGWCRYRGPDPGPGCRAGSPDRRLSRGELEERRFQVGPLSDQLVDGDAGPLGGVADRDGVDAADVYIVAAGGRDRGVAAEHCGQFPDSGVRTRIRPPCVIELTMDATVP